MKRLVLALSASLLLTGAALAQEEVPDPLPEEATETLVPLTPAIPTQPMQPDSLANQTWQLPKLNAAALVQAKAAAKAQQRRGRMAARAWYGYSKARPNLGRPVIVHARGWQIPQPIIVYPAARPNITGLDLHALVR